jgi:DNA-binding transcriptional ArsR family regulator
VIPLAKNLENYLSEVTGLKVMTDAVNRNDLPYFFSRQYALYRLLIGNTLFSAVFLREEDEFKPAQFIKHMRQVSPVNVDELCVVAESLPSYVRRRLIEKGIAFVVPKVQMYLPTLGMELRPRSVRKKLNTVERFSPATQVVLIHWLLGRVKGSLTPLELSQQLGYSAMTMSRALDELEAAKIAQVRRVGRERLVTFPEDRRAAWQDLNPRLRNPVSHTVRIVEHELHRLDALPAGISALSSRSMMNGPTYPEYAISRDVWKAMEKTGIEKIPVEEPGICLLQIWCYDPKILEVEGFVDPFSLYLGLQDENDERVEMALAEMMAQYPW